MQTAAPDAYGLIDADPEASGKLRIRHRELRAQALELAMRAAQASVIAHAGAARAASTTAPKRFLASCNAHWATIENH